MEKCKYNEIIENIIHDIKEKKKKKNIKIYNMNKVLIGALKSLLC